MKSRRYSTITESQQLTLWHSTPDNPTEHPDYLSKQLITYIGNKRSLLKHINTAVETVKKRLNKEKLRVADLFSGSGVVTRFLKAHSSFIISNDIEDYAYVIAHCYLRNRSEVDMQHVEEIILELNQRVDEVPLPMGFIEELYAPKDENNITKDDRVFYTRKNARRIDNYRRLIEVYDIDIKNLLLGPLLSEASIHANTSGVFKGFYKNRRTGIGQFGGSGSDALSRILGTIVLEPPVLSMFECEYLIFQEDANSLAAKLPSLDLVYIDPPYNQHPYGSNYFMLNLIVNYQKPLQISKVSGIPTDWRRSGYNVKSESPILFRKLVQDINSKFLLISFNNEGFIKPRQMMQILNDIGSVQTIELPYNAFRGSRNFNNRSIHVTEFLFLVERK